MIREAQRLHDLFHRGFLADSPDFIQEKQPDGRYLLKPKLGRTGAISRHVHVPTGLIKTITIEGWNSEVGDPGHEPVHVAATFQRITDGLPVTAGKFNLATPATNFHCGIGSDVFEFGVAVGSGLFPLGAGRFVWLEFLSNPDLANDCAFHNQRDGTGQQFGPHIDLSSGDFDQTLISFGIEWRCKAHIEWDR